MKTLECVVWCPHCETDEFKVWSVPIGGGVNINEVEGNHAIFCPACKYTLERKPTPGA